MKIKNLAVFAALATLITSSASVADVPDLCDSARYERMYNIGLLKGANIVNMSWNAVGDCSEVQPLRDAVTEAFNKVFLPEGASDAIICHFLGQFQGAFNRMDELQNQCTSECIVDGMFAGEMAAILYCELSVSLGGLALDIDLISGPVSECGGYFEMRCEDVFSDTTINYDSLFDPNVYCLPYTRGEFYQVWKQTRTNQCLYNPQLP